MTGLSIQASRIFGRGLLRASRLRAAILVAVAGLLLAGCQESDIPKQLKPVPPALVEKMRASGMTETSPVLIRIFKESSELEVWKQKRDGTYGLLKTYSICRWSGELGPKVAEGDRQAPEGFYTVTPAQMNPKSSYYLSFNIGYPNAYDRSLGRTGSNLMVHGACSSSGCYSMTDPDAGELFALARDAFRGGQRSFQIQAFPFRMTAENMAKHRDSKHLAFWKMLKVGSDHFEVTHRPPKVDVCNKRYVFDANSSGSFSPSAACPSYTVSDELKVAVAAKQSADDAAFDTTVVKLTADAKQAEEDERLAEEKRVADEKRAADKAAAKEARAEELQKKLGVFGRIFGGGKDEASSPAVASTPPAAEPAKETPAAAYAPTAAKPVPPKKPKAEAKAQPAPAPEPKAATTAAPVDAPISADAAPKPTIAPQASEDSPPVGTFVKKPFLWPGG